MSYTLVQAGAGLTSINNDGAFTALTLPIGVTLSTSKVPRFTRLNRYAIMVNSPSTPLTVDELGVVRALTIAGPVQPLVLSGNGSSTLSGTYLARYTYILKDTSGNIISESDYSPLAASSVTITNQFLRVTGIVPPTVAGWGIRLYRTTTGPGSVYFKWVDIDGAATTAYQDSLADAGLSIVAGPTLGPAPDLTLAKEWQARIWGVDRTDVDHLRFTESGVMYAWGALNTIPIPHLGEDAAGITGIIPRRNALGVGRRTSMAQITGTSLSNFACVTVPGGEGASFVSQESCIVKNDVAIFLGMDGVYRWDSTGISSITDNKVRSWFTTDDYFNRSMFYRAFAQLDRFSLKYKLFLCSVGSLVPDRWVEFDLTTGAWFGPHLTNAFTVASAVDVAGANGQIYPMIGGNEGYLSMEQEARNDWGLVGISSSFETIAHDLDDPDTEKYWGELSVNGKKQVAGTVEVTPTVGDLDATEQTPVNYDMTLGRHRIARMGVGKHLTLTFDHEAINEEVMLYGYEVNPVTIVGRR